MTPDASLPPLTDEELAHIELGASIGVLLRPTKQSRLIADLRAARAEVERLRARLEDPPGPEAVCEGPCCR